MYLLIIIFIVVLMWFIIIIILKNRISGSWINTYLESRCGEVLTELEEDFIADFSKWATLPTLQIKANICIGKLKWCNGIDGYSAKPDEL